MFGVLCRGWVGVARGGGYRGCECWFGGFDRFCGHVMPRFFATGRTPEWGSCTCVDVMLCTCMRSGLTWLLFLLGHRRLEFWGKRND